jgi:hypothetical protein
MRVELLRHRVCRSAQAADRLVRERRVALAVEDPVLVRVATTVNG